jgi:hypothetical protein
MPLKYLAQMRPLFLVALVLTWNAAAIVLKVHLPDRIPLVALLLLALAMFSLAVISIRAQRVPWARALVLRPGAESNGINPCLFFIGFLSFSFSAWLLLIAWHSATAS